MNTNLPEKEDRTNKELSLVHSRTLKERFDTLLLMKGMRQVDLADKLGVSRSYLNMIIHETKEASPKIRIKIAKALEVDSYVLWRGF